MSPVHTDIEIQGSTLLISSDFARAMSCMISPALKMGGIITDDFPLDVAEADQSQSGKIYRQKMVAALYNETPSVITARKGGVGSLDESVANALLTGRPFITLDNIRGNLDSPLLEMAAAVEVGIVRVQDESRSEVG